MPRNPREVSASGSIVVVLVLLTAIILEHALTDDARWYWCLFVTIPLITLAAFSDRNNRLNMK